MGFALKLLSIRERSVYEMREKLLSKGFGEEEAEAAIERLKGSGYLDDQRFAAGLASSRARTRNWGPLKIREELFSRGVAKEAADNAISALGGEEDAARRAFEKWRKSRGKASGAPLKAYRHLRARGFSHAVSMRLIETLK